MCSETLTPMKKLFTPIAIVAFLALAGCNKPATTDSATADNANAGNNIGMAEPAPMPPSIKTSATYRCDDKSVAKIDFMSDGLSANVTVGDKPPLMLKTEAAGSAMTSADGGRLSGTGAKVSLKLPGGASQACAS
jgi:hypothetical protein